MRIVASVLVLMLSSASGQQQSPNQRTNNQNQVNVAVNNGLLIVVKPEITKIVKAQMGGSKAPDNLLTPANDSVEPHDCPFDGPK